MVCPSGVSQLPTLVHTPLTLRISCRPKLMSASHRSVSDENQKDDACPPVRKGTTAVATDAELTVGKPPAGPPMRVR